MLSLLTSRLKNFQSTLSLSGGRKNGFWKSKRLFLGVKKKILETRAFYNLQWVAARYGHADAATRAKFTKSRRKCGHPRQLKRRFRSPSVSENKVLIRFLGEKKDSGGETKIKETL